MNYATTRTVATARTTDARGRLAGLGTTELGATEGVDAAEAATSGGGLGGGLGDGGLGGGEGGDEGGGGG